MKLLKTLFLVVLLALPKIATGQKFDGLAQQPPMGWNSWNRFGSLIDEKIVRETADKMVSTGMLAAGYQYLIIDDCWQGKRDSLGFIHPNPEKFPSGMKSLVDYVHAKGLKFGIYSDAGTETCARLPGSRGHEYQDAMTYASWGVDYLKYDWCFADWLSTKGSYITMRDALHAAGRPVVFSICEWGSTKPWEWALEVGHLWRTTGDIRNCFDCTDEYASGVLQILDKQKDLRQYAGPGHWNDPDMLVVGNDMPITEDRSHFTMWCMLAAPLIASNNLNEMTPDILNVLTNKTMIAIDQDALGIQGFMHDTDDGVEYWYKPLADGRWAVVFLNRNNTGKTINYKWKKVKKIIDELSGRELHFNTDTYTIANIWEAANDSTTATPYTAKLAPHGVVALILEKI